MKKECMKKSKWMRIPFIDNDMEASTSGEIRDAKTKNIIKPYKRQGGYLQFAAMVNGKIKTTYVHRCVLAAHNPKDDYEKLDVHHKDHNPSNNRLDNLVWCTARENALYSLSDGRMEYSRIKASENARNQLKNGTHAFFNLTPEQHRKKYIVRESNYRINGSHPNKGRNGLRGTNCKMTEDKIKIVWNLHSKGYKMARIARER